MPQKTAKLTCGHTDRPHHAKGLCRKCWWAASKSSPDATPEAAVRGVKERDRVAGLQEANRKLLEALELSQDRLDTMTRLKGRQGPGKVLSQKGRGIGKKRQGVPVILLSDWHIEEPVTKAQTSGLNEYNLDIADRCISRVTEAFDWFLCDSRYDFREAVVWYGGDLYSGYIHEELQEANALSPTESVLWLQRRIEKQLLSILAASKLEIIHVVCNDGNHGRLTHKTRIATRTKNSLEWLMYKSLAARFEGEKRLRFQVAEGEYNYMSVYDTEICFMHGDSFKYQGGVGGLLVPVQRGLNELRKYRKIDVACLGHFHQRLDLPGVAVNGSMIGINAYSMHLKCTPEPRQQSFFIVDSVRGKCVSAPVWL